MSRDVLLLIEHRDGHPEPVVQQLVQQACALAGRGRVAGLVLCGPGAGVVESLARSGLDALHVVEDADLAEYSPEAFGRVAEQAVRRLAPGLFLCAHSFQGMEVAPWVAARLGVPLLSNCVSLVADGDELVAERLVHGQAWQLELRAPWQGTAVASLARSGGAAEPPADAPRATVEKLDVDPATLGIRTRVRGATRPAPGDVDLSRAEVVVGVGRGVRDPSNLKLVEELAAALGGVVGCSRPLVDLGWLAYERQVGASGREIHAKLYVACGISGAAQHLAGIADAETVVAINQDARAPIFRVAHYGVVGDLLDVVPRLTAELRRRRA